jgi:ABC-2 type transport system permease protein
VNLTVLRRALLDRRRSLLWWSVGVLAYVAMIVAVYPTIRDASGINELVQQYPEGLMALFGVDSIDFTSGAGYLATELFGFVLPLLVLILTIGTGANAVGGAEERGILDLVLSHPVSRRSYYIQQAVVVVVEAAILGGVVIATLLVAEPLVDLELSIANLVGTVLGLALVALVLGWSALALGAATGSRALALGGASAFAAFGYLAATLPELVDGLGPVRWISPFWYGTAGNPLVTGFTWWHTTVLAAGALVILGLGLARFERRNLSS